MSEPETIESPDDGDRKWLNGLVDRANAGDPGALAEVARCLRPGGRLIVHEINVHNPFFRFYMNYVFPLLTRIDLGNEWWLSPFDAAWHDRFVPVQVKGIDSGAQSIVVGGYHSCAVLGESVKCWGNNSHCQLGPERASSISTRAPERTSAPDAIRRWPG